MTKLENDQVLFDSFSRSLRALSTAVDDRLGPNAMSSHKTPDGDLGPFDATVDAPLDPLFEKLTERFDAEVKTKVGRWDGCPRQQKNCDLKLITGFPQYVVCKCGEIAAMEISEKDDTCQFQPLKRLKHAGMELVRLHRKGHSYLFYAKDLVEEHFNYPAPSESIRRVPCDTVLMIRALCQIGVSPATISLMYGLQQKTIHFIGASTLEGLLRQQHTKNWASTG